MSENSSYGPGRGLVTGKLICRLLMRSVRFMFCVRGAGHESGPTDGKVGGSNLPVTLCESRGDVIGTGGDFDTFPLSYCEVLDRERLGSVRL